MNLTRVSVAGVTFHQSAIESALQSAAPAQMVVRLEPEPTNPYDKNAIRVLVNGHHVGYVPRTLAARLSATDVTSARVCSAAAGKYTHVWLAMEVAAS